MEGIVLQWPALSRSRSQLSLKAVSRDGKPGVPISAVLGEMDFLALLATLQIHLLEDRYLLMAALPASTSILRNLGKWRRLGWGSCGRRVCMHVQQARAIGMAVGMGMDSIMRGLDKLSTCL